MLRRIAVIEDNADNRLLVRAMLEERYHLDEYESGRAALQGMRSTAPEVVLLDISLPEMDGPEVLRQLRSDPALGKLKVIALTAHAMTGDREKYLRLGFDDYITKPIVDEQHLLDAIERALPEQAPSA